MMRNSPKKAKRGPNKREKRSEYERKNKKDREIRHKSLFPAIGINFAFELEKRTGRVVRQAIIAAWTLREGGLEKLGR